MSQLKTLHARCRLIVLKNPFLWLCLLLWTSSFKLSQFASRVYCVISHTSMSWQNTSYLLSLLVKRTFLKGSAILKIQIFSGVTLCRRLNSSAHFEGSQCGHLQGPRPRKSCYCDAELDVDQQLSFIPIGPPILDSSLYVTPWHIGGRAQGSKLGRTEVIMDYS